MSHLHEDKTMRRLLLCLTIIAFATGAYGKVDLVTLSDRDTVQLTIYNSADLTLIRESRYLTLKEGWNELQFSWANTLIDPTSLAMIPKAHAGRIDIADLTYPPRVQNLGLWNVRSEMSGEVPVEITYLTSGLTWRAFYMGTLSGDEKIMRLEGYVRVTNNSGEDYEDAQIRMIVGKVHLLDRIAELARRQYPYERPGQPHPSSRSSTRHRALAVDKEAKATVNYLFSTLAKEPEIKKEGLSEYFLYTIDRKDTVANGWSKRLLSFEADDVPVVNLYKFEQERYGNAAVRFLSFRNDTEHKLGETPIPGGLLKVYRSVDAANHLSYTGQSSFKYIPVNEDVELNLGAAADVIVEPTLMERATENYRFDRVHNIAGWDDVQTHVIDVRNTRAIPIRVEIKRNFDTQYWTLKNMGDFGQFEREDLDTVKYTLDVAPQSKRRFEYTVRLYRGSREDDWRKIQP